MSITKQEVLYLASLVKMSLSQDELDKLGTDLSQILKQFQVLEQLEIPEGAQASHPHSNRSILRADQSAEAYGSGPMLQNAPHVQENLIRVKAILD
jgi:aspartyl-tRNA(Asn)/glutamyl-tRNA(Gln) amidotransferase subunit C